MKIKCELRNFIVQQHVNKEITILGFSYICDIVPVPLLLFFSVIQLLGFFGWRRCILSEKKKKYATELTSCQTSFTLFFYLRNFFGRVSIRSPTSVSGESRVCFVFAFIATNDHVRLSCKLEPWWCACSGVECAFI